MFEGYVDKEKKLLEFEIVALTEKNSARLQNNLPLKLKDLGSSFPISIEVLVLLVFV